jgi:hypothetical protein
VVGINQEVLTFSLPNAQIATQAAIYLLLLLASLRLDGSVDVEILSAQVSRTILSKILMAPS